MQLTMPHTKIETSEVMTEETFGIGDVAVILELLRSKMYSNPVRTIVQEICSNARDAHREIGNGNVPFEIKLPTRMDLTFSVRDFGPGLTPERMANVFIKYGNSTKRSDNSQTGGFGLGAKSPWAYADQFLIESITPENGTMMKRCYSAVIDESRCGKLILMHSEETTELQGVKISLGVRPTDINDFEIWTRNRIANWNWNGEPLPVIVGRDTFDWEHHKPMFNGDSKGGKWDLEIGTYNRNVEAIIDGVPYEVDQSSLKNLSPRLSVMFNRRLRLFFKVGELSVAATRENLDYTETTINKIKVRMAEVFESLAVLVTKRLQDAKNLWEANVQFNDLKREFNDMVKGVKWNDIEITGESLSIPGNVTHFEFQERSNGRFLKGSSENSRISFQKNTLVVVNDLGVQTPNRNRIRRMFEDLNPSAIYCVTFRTESEDATVDAKIKENYEKFLKDSNWDKFETLNLSAFEPLKPPKVTVKNADGKPRTMVRCRKFQAGHTNYVTLWPEVKDVDISELDGYYVVLKERHAYLANGKPIGGGELGRLKDYVGGDVEIYGVMQNFAKHIPDDLVPLDNLIEEAYNEALEQIEFGVDPATESEHDIQKALSYNLADLLGRNKSKLGQEIQDWLDVSKKAQKYTLEIRKVEFLGQYIGKTPKFKDSKVLEAAAQAAVKAYPLITSFSVDSGYYGRSNTYKPDTSEIIKYLG